MRRLINGQSPTVQGKCLSILTTYPGIEYASTSYRCQSSGSSLSCHVKIGMGHGNSNE